MKGSRPLSLLEIQAVSNAFSGKYEIRNRTIFILGINTGGRISELLSLNVGDVWKYDRPKKEVYFKKENTKGKLEGRRIAIKAGARDMIREFIYWKKRQGESLERSAPLFVSRENKRLTRQQAHNVLSEAFSVCELSGHVSTHSMRKTFANHVLRASNGNVKVLQELMGHHKLSTTQAYLGVSEAELRDAVPDFEFDKGAISSNSKVIPLSIRVEETSQKQIS